MTNANPDIRALVISVLARITGAAGIGDNMLLKRDLGISSMGFVDLFFEVEQALGKKMDVRHLFLELSIGELGKNDLRVKEFVEYLENLLETK